jgi:hypothetical protein
VTWKDKLEIGLKEDAPYRKTICRRVKSVARKSRRDRADLLKSRWRVVTRTNRRRSLAFARQCARLAHHPRAERSSETQAQGCLTVRLEQARRDRPYRSRLDVRADLSRQKPARLDVVPSVLDVVP